MRMDKFRKRLDAICTEFTKMVFHSHQFFSERIPVDRQTSNLNTYYNIKR